MNPIISSIKKFLFKRVSLILIWGFIVIVLLIIYNSFIRKGNPIIPITLPNIQVRMSDSRSIRLSDAPSVQIPAELFIYKIDEERQIQNPQTFFQQFIQEKISTPAIYGEHFYTQDSAGNTFSYSPATENVLINTSDPSVLKDVISNSEDSIESFLRENGYYQEFSFTDILEDGKQVIEGHTRVGDYHLEPRGALENTLEARFDGEAMTYFRSNLVDFSEYRKYPTLPLNSVNANLRRESYPKDISYSIHGNYMKQVEYPALLSSLSFKRVSVRSVEVVYLLIDKDSEYLIPVFKIKGTSTGTLSDETELDLDVLIYASAIDPSYLSAEIVKDTFIEEPPAYQK